MATEFQKDDHHYDQVNQIWECINKHAKKGDVDSVISAMDKHCETMEAMHIGKDKGTVFDSVFQEKNPKVVLELGTFFAYSVLRLARLIQPGGMIYTIEFDPKIAKVATEIVEYAGSQDKVKVVCGSSTDVIPRFKTDEFPVSTFDFVFIDHHKPLYKPDLILLEELKLIAKGSVVLADNVLFPGAPDYAEYVKNSPKYESTTFPCKCTSRNGGVFDDEMVKSIYLG